MPAQHLHSDICIIGSGAVGKAAALGLSQAGLRVSLLSTPSTTAKTEVASAAIAASVTPWDLRVFALNPTAQNLLTALKVWDALDLMRVSAVQGMQINDATTATTNLSACVGFDAYAAHTNELAWILEDRNLNQALDSALKFAQNMTVVYGQGERLEVDAACASVYLEDGGHLSASLVVGADGAQSWVRGQCEIGVDYRSYGQQGVVANFSCEKPHQGIARQWFVGDQGVIALLPLAGQQVSLVWSAPDQLAEILLREPLQNVAERLAVYSQAALGRLTPLQPEISKAFPLNFVRPHQLIAPRVALIGDAAHVVHPLAGQGLNLGFGDVCGLINAINQREAHRDCGDARVLARYARARKEELALMQLATDGLARLFGSDLGALRVARQLGLNLLDRLPVIKRQLISHALGKS